MQEKRRREKPQILVLRFRNAHISHDTVHSASAYSVGTSRSENKTNWFLYSNLTYTNGKHSHIIMRTFQLNNRRLILDIYTEMKRTSRTQINIIHAKQEDIWIRKSKENWTRTFLLNLPIESYLANIWEERVIFQLSDFAFAFWIIVNHNHWILCSLLYKAIFWSISTTFEWKK